MMCGWWLCKSVIRQSEKASVASYTACTHLIGLLPSSPVPGLHYVVVCLVPHSRRNSAHQVVAGALQVVAGALQVVAGTLQVVTGALQVVARALQVVAGALQVVAGALQRTMCCLLCLQ